MTAEPKPKQRADKGAKHAPGAGRPVGTGKPRPIDAGLNERMKKLDTWLSGASDTVKASGIAIAAGLDKADLQKLRAGLKPLTDERVTGIELAAYAFLKQTAAALGYQVSIR